MPASAKARGQLCTHTRLVRSLDAEGMETLGLLEPGGFGCLDLLSALERRDEYHPAPPLLRRATGDDELQVCACRSQSGEFVRQPAGAVINRGGPCICTAYIQLHNYPPVSCCDPMLANYLTCERGSATQYSAPLELA